MALIGSLDANVALRLLLGDVPKQRAQATRLLARGEFRLSDVAVGEMAYVLTVGYHLTREQGALLLRERIAQPGILASSFLPTALDSWQQHPNLSFEDCLLAAQADAEAASPLWTFDRKLTNQTTAQLVPPVG